MADANHGDVTADGNVTTDGDVRNDSKMYIPRIIHQIWFDCGNGAEVPQKYHSYQESWKRHNPHYEYILWNEQMADAFMRQYYPKFYKSVYSQYNAKIYKIDSFRDKFLPVIGGVYADMDMECYRCLDDLLRGKKLILCRTTSNNPLLNNTPMMSVPGHPFWTLFRNLQRKTGRSPLNAKKSWIGTMFVAGPGLLSYAAAAYKLQGGTDMTILDNCYFTPRSAQDRALAYGDHKFHKSWGSDTRLKADVQRLAALVVGLLVLRVAYKRTRARKTSCGSS